MDLAQAPARRTKKRPSYGIRTVELTRAQLGFGFTLSGQGPCILSGIVASSPAARAGLKAGDHVVAVNGKNVARSRHDDVVALIGNSTGLLKLQIAESYCSNSSSDEMPPPPPRPLMDSVASDEEEYTAKPPSLLPLPIRPLHMRGNSADSTLTESSIVAQIQRPRRISPRKKLQQQKVKMMPLNHHVDLGGSEELQVSERDIHSFLHPTLDELRKSVKQLNSARGNSVDLSQAVAKAVVGYLGTIEMPEMNGDDGLLAIRNCVRRLRVEKKVHTMVLMAVWPEKTVLINHHGLKLAEYPASQVAFCGMCTDNKQFFGLVTSRPWDVEDEHDEQSRSSSCHVFMTESIEDKSEMQRRAAAFQFEPTPREEEGFEEFPDNADPIIDAIMSLYGKQNDDSAVVGQPQQQPLASPSSSQSSSGSTNSDSGIGYRDEAHVAQQAGAVAPPIQEEPRDLKEEDYMEDSFNTDRLDSQNSADNLRQSMQKYLASKHQHLKRVSQQLVANRPTEFRQSLATMSMPGGGGGGLPPYQHPPQVDPTAEVSKGAARSLENLPRDEHESHVKRAKEELVAMNVVQQPVPPMSRFFYSSESNLNHVVTTASDKNSQVFLPPPPAPVKQGSGILRPCDQYPATEPGVLKSRPLSAQSGRVVGHIKESMSTNSQEQEDHHSDDNASNKGSESKGWSRSSSLRKHLRRRSFSSSRIDQVGQQNAEQKVNGEDVTITDVRDPDTISQTGSQAGSLASERGIDIGRVGAWATDFEKLLADPIGLRTFAEFLKKEFSHENIYFWTACERFRRQEDERRRKAIGEEILHRHLSSGAAEPVNVDSHARQAAHDGVPNPSLFATAQKQIYNLMKFDSFSRFLKSDLYKESLVAEMAGKALPFEHAHTDALLDIGLQSPPESLGRKSKLTSTLSSAHSENGDQPGRRRSILPWNNMRSKDRSKSKDRESTSSIGGQNKVKKTKSTDNIQQQQQYHSMTSLASSSNAPPLELHEQPLDTTNESGDDLSQNCTLARVILPDKATTVVQTRPGETIRSMVARLLDKRALRYTSFDVFAATSDKPLDLGEDSTSLGCTEVRVEPRVLFRLELPSKKSIGVKAKPAKLVREVLGPILAQYGWNLDAMTVRRDVPNSHGGHVDPDVALVDLEATVATIDNSRLLVAPRNPTDIVNSRLLEEMVKTKVPSGRVQDDQRSHGTASSNESVGRRGSSSIVQTKKTENRDDQEKMAMPPPDAIPQVRRHTQRFGGRFDKHSAVTDELYEGLKLAQRGRLEDQRGTEIKFEMPDFLKRGTNKENFGPPPYQHPPQTGRLAASRQSEPVLPHPPSSQQHQFPRPQQRRDMFSDRLSSSSNHGGGRMHHSMDYYSVPHNDSNFSNDGYLPSLQEADRFFGVAPEDTSFNSSRLSLGMRYQQQQGDPMYETLSQYRTGQQGPRRWSATTSNVSLPSSSNSTNNHRGPRREPPPLPPKPRLAPFRSAQSDVGAPSSHHQTQDGFPRPGDRGYSVSFV